MEKKENNPKYLAVLAKLRLMDDTLMTSVFEDNMEGVTLLLHVLLERDDLTVKQVTVQKKYTNLLGHSVWLDIVAEDTDGKLYDIEVQRSSEGANPRRARYHSSMLDSRLLAKGEDYTALKDSYVIFITESDLFHKGIPLYHFERTLREGGEAFGDGSHIIYANGAYDNNEDPVGRLMHDFRCSEADEMLHPVLAERVRYLKEYEGGRNNMCSALEELIREACEEAVKKVREETAEKVRKVRKETTEKVRKVRKETAEKVREETAEKVRKEAEKKARAETEQKVREVRAETEQKVREETAKEVRAETSQQVRKETALTLLSFGLLSQEKIAEASGLSVEEVRMLDAQRTA